MLLWQFSRYMNLPSFALGVDLALNFYPVFEVTRIGVNNCPARTQSAA